MGRVASSPGTKEVNSKVKLTSGRPVNILILRDPGGASVSSNDRTIEGRHLQVVIVYKKPKLRPLLGRLKNRRSRS